MSHNYRIKNWCCEVGVDKICFWCRNSPCNACLHVRTVQKIEFYSNLPGARSLVYSMQICVRTLSVTPNATLMTSINNKLRPPTTCLVAYNQTIIIKFQTGSNRYFKLEYIAQIMPVKSVTGEQEASFLPILTGNIIFTLYRSLCTEAVLRC